MSDSDNGTKGDLPADGQLPFQPDDRNWCTDPELQKERLRDQVRIILDSLPGSVAYRGDSDDLGDTQYLCRGGSILLRDADLERVHAVLGGDGSPQARVEESRRDTDRPMINGLTTYSVPGGDAQAALRKVDQALGVGVTTPDHVLYVTPAGCCPATEPLQPGQDNPDPEINRDPATSGRGVLVSVVDTGLLPELVASGRAPWLEGVTGDPEIFDSNQQRHYLGHGTFIAGVVRCMAPEAQVRVEGFLPTGGAIYESEIVQQLNESLAHAPDIISLSAGTTTRSGLALLGFEVFWETRLRHFKGTVLVAAAGNDGNRGPFWPAAFPWALSVGALDMGGGRAPYSNFGSWVDVYARGSDVVNAYPDGVYTYQEAPHKGQTTTFDRGMATWSGTSFATPLVAGLIAARMSRTGESARTAAEALRALSLIHATAGVGPILEPGMASW